MSQAETSGAYGVALDTTSGSVVVQSLGFPVRKSRGVPQRYCEAIRLRSNLTPILVGNLMDGWGGFPGFCC